MEPEGSLPCLQEAVLDHNEIYVLYYIGTINFFCNINEIKFERHIKKGLYWTGNKKN
jgi:hypothetical protein